MTVAALQMLGNGIARAMSRSGIGWDNAAMESFVSSRKTERTARKTYRARNLPKQASVVYRES